MLVSKCSFQIRNQFKDPQIFLVLNAYEFSKVDGALGNNSILISHSCVNLLSADLTTADIDCFSIPEESNQLKASHLVKEWLDEDL
jgi:hypothetical protein